jgi:hypothetical protein
MPHATTCSVGVAESASDSQRLSLRSHTSGNELVEDTVDKKTLITVTRGAAQAIDSRNSLTVGAAALLAGALHQVRSAHAGNGGSKGGKRCKRQREQCVAFLEERCVQAVARAGAERIDCVTQNMPCCEELGKCHAGTALDCLFLRSVK